MGEVEREEGTVATAVAVAGEGAGCRRGPVNSSGCLMPGCSLGDQACAGHDLLTTRLIDLARAAALTMAVEATEVAEAVEGGWEVTEAAAAEGDCAMDQAIRHCCQLGGYGGDVCTWLLASGSLRGPGPNQQQQWRFRPLWQLDAACMRTSLALLTDPAPGRWVWWR